MFFRQFLEKRNQSKQRVTVNLSTSVPLSLAEYAALSHDVYFNEQATAPSLPDGWKRLLDSGPTTKGYFGAVYVKHEENPTHVVFAHRADISTVGSDLITNLQAAFNRIPNQYLSADVFLGKALDALIRKYGEETLDTINLSATGHAFGGMLAEICSAHSIPTVTFENPGAKNTFQKIYRHEVQEAKRSPFKIEAMMNEMLVRMHKYSRNYCNDMNAINTAQEPIGNTFMILPCIYDFTNDNLFDLQQLTPHVAKNKYYTQHYTLQQNQMLSILEKLKDAPLLKPVKHPAGFQKAYLAYLDYDKRQAYWDELAKVYWSKNISQQVQYADDFSAFKNDFLQHLKAVYEIALITPEKESLEGSETLSFNIGGFSLFSHPENKPPKLEDHKQRILEDEFEMVNKPQIEPSEGRKKSVCIVM